MSLCWDPGNFGTILEFCLPQKSKNLSPGTTSGTKSNLKVCDLPLRASDYSLKHVDNETCLENCGEFSWGGVEGWGEKAYNCNWITIKIYKKKKTVGRIIDKVRWWRRIGITRRHCSKVIGMDTVTILPASGRCTGSHILFVQEAQRTRMQANAGTQPCGSSPRVHCVPSVAQSSELTV